MTDVEYRTAVVDRLTWIASILLVLGVALGGYLHCIAGEIDDIYLSTPRFPDIVKIQPMRPGAHGWSEKGPLQVELVEPRAEEADE
ncbi:unnamed protein product [marine sediment metagenome]|uniref:Uncharacterized protein n=1 Tax=marine sediment metagenome TaxID=412755 RepID=X0THL1_9ZZZZ